MAEAEVQEVSTPESVEVAPPSNADTLSIEAPVEAEPSTEQAESAPEPEAPPEPRTPQEIIAAYNKRELITDEEREVAVQWQRAEDNRAHARQQAAEFQRRKNQEVLETVNKHPSEVIDTFFEELQSASTEGRGVSKDVLSAKLNPKIEALKSALKPALLLNETAAARIQLATHWQEAGKDPNTIYNWLEANNVSLTDTVKAAYESGIAIGKDTSEAAVELAKVKAELAKVKAENTRATAARGAAGPSAAGASQGSTVFANEAALSRAFNNNEIDRAGYAREYKRITGREP
jgi:hypothetical protein